MRYTAFLLGIALLATGAAQAEPANVFWSDGICGVGWLGCSLDDAVLQPDGSYACLDLGLVTIAGRSQFLQTNSPEENAKTTCQTRIEFSQPNASGVLGGFEQVVPVPIKTVCALFPDACQADGAVIVNQRTVGGIAVCSFFGQTTTIMQAVTAPNGTTTLQCRLPDR